jgi:hypothetical protein
VVRCVCVGWVGVRPGVIRRGRCGALGSVKFGCVMLSCGLAGAVRLGISCCVAIWCGRRGELRLCVFCWGTFRQAGYVESW